MDNYERSKERAQQYFLRFDQDSLVRKWKLRQDEKNLYVVFFRKEYALCRTTGAVTRTEDGTPAGYEEALSIFDLLCHEGIGRISGRIAPVNSLKGSPKMGGVGTDFYVTQAVRFDKEPQLFRKACLALGGQEIPAGDVGFRFSVFRNLCVTLKFYHGDEDFPPSVTLLWDENMLSFVYYETVFYIGGILLKQLGQKMDQLKSKHKELPQWF